MTGLSQCVTMANGCVKQYHKVEVLVDGTGCRRC